MQITSQSALWFLPFVTPVCLWVIWSDLRSMKIPNKAVMTLVGIFVVVGLVALPLADYPWRFAHLGVMLLVGIIANAAGAMGAGDAKFIAAAAPFVVLGDFALVCFIFAASLLGAFATHRLAKHTALRQLAPDWESWTRGRKFPMGFALGGTLVIYLALGLAYGQ